MRSTWENCVGAQALLPAAAGVKKDIKTHFVFSFFAATTMWVGRYNYNNSSMQPMRLGFDWRNVHRDKKKWKSMLFCLFLCYDCLWNAETETWVKLYLAPTTRDKEKKLSAVSELANLHLSECQVYRLYPNPFPVQMRQQPALAPAASFSSRVFFFALDNCEEAITYWNKFISVEFCEKKNKKNAFFKAAQ